MKLKQHFPLLVLITLSAALMIVLPLIRFFALQPQQDALQQLEPSFQFRVFFLGLTDALWKAVLILLCFWSGVGINRLLLRIQDSAKRKLAINGVIFGSLFLCVVLPILGLILTYTFLSPKESWVQLPDPPEAARTISGGIYNRIIIETEKGIIFRTPFQTMVWDGWQMKSPTLLFYKRWMNQPHQTLKRPGYLQT